jgi:hypothetical protein
LRSIRRRPCFVYPWRVAAGLVRGADFIDNFIAQAIAHIAYLNPD